MSDIMQRKKEARERSLKVQAEQKKAQQVRVQQVDIAKQEEFKRNNVQLKTGEWVSKTEYEKLSAEDQQRIMNLGIKGFNDYYAKQEADFKANNIQIGDSWISKEAYNSLSGEDQQRIKDLGIEGFNEYYEQKQAEFERNNIQLNTGEWISKVDYAKYTPQWQGELKNRGIDGFQSWLSTAYPGADGFIVIDDPAAGKMIYGKTDDPNIGIDAGGNRIWIGGRWPDAVKTYLQGVEIKGSEIISKKQLVTEKPADLAKIEGFQTGIEAQPEIIKLDTGEYIDRQTYDSLDKEYQDKLMKDGIAGLEKQIKSEEIKASEDRKQQIEITKAELAKLGEKQKSFEAQSLWDKVIQTVKTPVTFSEIVQEILTFGGAKTQAFDKAEIDKEYHEARLKALEAGSDLGISKEEYENQVLSKQMTAQELGMQLVPFEYARPGRFNELQLWEKIVYPALDIVSLVPVVGLAGKGVSALAKGASTGAKIAALGGKAAIEFAAKDAVMAVEKASAQKLVKEGLLQAVKEGAQNATDKTVKQVLSGAVKAAEKDLKVATKEYNQIIKNSEELGKLSQVAGKAEIPTKGSAVYRASAMVEEKAIKAGKYTEPLDITGSTGVVGYSTISNWNDLTPEQRAGGLALAAMSSGILGKARNIAENIIDPYKIPIAALKPRAARTEAVAGKIFAAEKDTGIKGTTRLVLDHTMKPEDARTTVASLMRQLTEGEDVAKAKIKTTEGEKEIKVKGTGLQKTVGKTSISATPMGEIFKEGTGAAGAKTNLEKYLQQANIKYGTGVEIEAKPLKIGDTELEVKTISTPGVTVKGSEGGMYLGAQFYNQFAHKAAFGAGGKISAGLLVSTPGISELPKNIRNAGDIVKMQEKAFKEFDGAKHINKEVEGFKKYTRFMEFENVITNGSQLQRSQNLRSKLADKLHGNKGEYYTRDPKGKIELFQMYLEGGRATPYTMKELYALKGNALRNSLEDLFFGLEKKIDDLKSGKLISTKENIITKEEHIAKAFSDIDDTVARKGMTDAEAKRLKNEIMAEYRSRFETMPNRERVRKTITELGSRSEAKRREDERADVEFVDRARADREQVRRDIAYRGSVREVARDRIPGRETLRAGEERAVPRESVRELPREIPRGAERLREQPRELPRGREAPREQPRETLREVPREVPKNATKINQVVKFLQDNAKGKEITEKQIEGSIAWKQGFIYHLHWPPFGENDVFYSREPIPGVRYFDGIGSAAKSAVTLYGEIPQNIRLDMGIVDIDITRAERTGQPKLGFKGDPKQKTKYISQAKNQSSIKISK